MSGPLLCVTVTAATTAEMRLRRDTIVDADIVELRLDTVRDPDVEGALAGRRKPVIVTCRPTWEGGNFAGSEEERRRILSAALAKGAEYVDLEWRSNLDEQIDTTNGRRVVLSMHDYEGVPSDLADRARAMRSKGVEVVKVAVKTRCLADCVPLLDIGRQIGSDGGLVVIGMGDHGIATRVLPDRFRSRWTYAGSLADVGQLDASSLLGEYRIRSNSDATAIYGIVGGSIGHSVSPAMQNAAFRAARVDAVYLPLPAIDADDVCTFGRAIGLAGASITIPHKVSLFDRVDDLSPAARRIGAINTIRVENGRWIGRNTDVNGFLAPLQEGIALPGLRASVLGAGGAARAVSTALAGSGCSVRLHARNHRQAEEVAKLAQVEVGPWPPEPGTWDMLVNCTPVGMRPLVDQTPVPATQLTGRYVYDLIYNPPMTRLLSEAAAAGCRTIGGLEMLVAQAEEQFEWWVGMKPPKNVMRDAAVRRLAELVRHEHYVI
jgi:3-dehydroquinate dehydratase/shikimate dehydrogenase